MSCRGTQRRLEVDHERPASADLEHLSRCPECAAHRGLLRELYAEARASVSEPPTPALLSQVEGQARTALRRAHAPSPLRREILLPLGIALFALPIALAQGWLWLSGLRDQSERCSSFGRFTPKCRSARLASPTDG